ncbi:MAG TPA: hypothetical protein PLS25_07935 [Methanoregulaceae archaeon]|jgi:hypothetical protein|nr:hypothetical protein [Methanoregulaceae archaeon]
MNREKELNIIGIVQGSINAAYQQLLERAGGVQYLWGELVAVTEDHLKENPAEVMRKLAGVAGLLDAVAGSLEHLANDMEFCERELGGVLGTKAQAA